ncbi:MAG: DUF3108 domain-containing protein [Pseudomonadota bacterium]
MHHTLRLLCLFGVFTTASAAPPLPGDFSAHYVIKKGPIELGVARRSLRRVDETAWVYAAETRSTGGVLGMLFKFYELKQSRISLSEQQLRVETYTHKREGNNPTALKQLFAWDQGRVTTTWDDGEVVAYEITPGMYDQNMYQLAIMLDLQQGLQTMTYRLAENRRMKVYEIRVLRREKIQTAVGDYNAYVVANRDNSAETMMWCAEELNYLPVRIEYEDSGIRINAQISRVEGLRQ